MQKRGHIYIVLLMLMLGLHAAVWGQADSTGDYIPMGSGYTPGTVTTTVEYNAETGEYVRVTKVGDMVIEREYMTFEEYQDWQMDQLMSQYWKEKTEGTVLDNAEGGLLSKIPGFNQIAQKLDLLNGKPLISINPSGSAELTFQIVNNFRNDPQRDQHERSVTTFDFDENIQINLNAKIGDLIDFDINENTKATFDFENKIKLKYEGKEDDILQLFEAADISFPLNTTLIQGSQQLFGFHTKLKFGKLTIDAVLSEKETSTENMQVQGGASSHEFEIRADEYEENRHYFIAQYFYDNYNKAMSTLPTVNSNIRILRIEVWRTNVGAAVTQNRNILALTDLGEANPSNSHVYKTGTSTLPSNNVNNLLSWINPAAVRSINSVTSYMQGIGMTGGSDYEKIESARLLNSNEYTFNRELGFITLNQPLSNDQVLAVAFQYQVVGDTNVYQVGELTTDGINDPNTLIVKLLKGTSTDTHGPLWKLMMKNVYFLKSSQLSRDNFRLNVLYESAEGGVGIGFFSEGPQQGKPLIEVFGLDRMDATQSYYYADGVFDWFDSAAFKGGTIQASTGRIYFPYVEPFGRDLRVLLGNDEIANRYCFDSLYTMTQALAQQYADRNRFYLEGYYTSSVSGEISLGYSVTPGSVTVTAGGMPLIENVDYTVDYTMGTVRIINESILSSNTPISVSSENNSFSMTTKRMLGLHLNYEFEPNFNIGATVMNLHEKPLTQKNNFGDEPASNSIWGLDVNYSHEVPLITRLIDLLPGIDTKAPSNLSLQAEFAHFIPGMSSTGSSEGSVSYVDDFEGAESSISLTAPTSWFLASTPQDYASSLPMFPEAGPGTGLAYGFNRAKLAWYRISRDFYDNNCPSNITLDDRSKPYARSIAEQEVFPNKDLTAGQPTAIYELNLAYYPEEKGPYNYDVAPTAYSAGIDASGKLQNPASRWGGIMRKLDYTDFETQNIETIEFWLMDPFIENPTHSGGKLYINLGDISEDILRDGRKSFENGLPTSLTVVNVDTTMWGRVPTTQPIVNAFDNDESARKYQDVGYDGLGSTQGLQDEQSFFADYLEEIALRFGISSEAYQMATADPSGDDYRYFRSSYYDQNDVKINDRYKYYNNAEGNSPVDSDNQESYNTTGSAYPNVEDINKDNTLSEAENYYQYVIDIDPNRMVIGENHIVDIQEARNVQLANGETTTCKWYQFRIPIREPDQKVGNINGFQSVRFMRMFLNQFEEPVILRFATLDLVYSTWRKYSEDLLQPGDYVSGTSEETSFNISTVNIEENGSRQPVPYVLPPGIERETWYTTGSSYTQLNEQAVVLDVDQLSNGDARAIYRSTSYDLRFYGHMKMFVHAEQKYAADQMDDDDMELFVRLGSDYTSNYYEYELPLKLTPWGTTVDDPYGIWPINNNVDIDLQMMTEIKTHRNTKIRGGEARYSPTLLYSERVEGKKYTVLGNPNLGKIKVIMIGVRNPRKESLNDGDNMLPKSVIVWINELRLSDYINKGGWAAMALARTNLADVGNLSLYGSYTTANFGNLEDPLIKEELVNTFNFQSTLDMELGRFLPDEWGMHIPLYLDYTREIGSPEYNPYNPDVLLYEDLQTYKTAAERDSVAKMTQHRRSATNLTLTNVRKNRVGKSSLKPHFYDIENFSFSYAYSRERASDDETESYSKDQHRGGFTYNYTLQPKQVKPFANVKMFKDKNWKIINDINFYYQPKSLSFSTEIYRDYEETLLRNKSAALVILRPTYYKQFTWQRDYGVQYDLSRTLRIQYSANANARIDEPIGRIETPTASDSIWHSISSGGTMQNFQQSINVTYELPINKLPYMEFLRTPLSYRTNFNYQGTTQALASMGSILQNSTVMQASAQANMQTLYNKIPLFKNAWANDGGNGQRDKQKGGKQQGAKPETKPMTAKDSVAMADSLRQEKVKQILKDVGYFALRIVSGVKNVNLQYNVTRGSRLPGYMGEPMLVGLDPRTGWSPGAGYILGYQQDVVNNLLRNDLLSRDTLFNTPHEMTKNRTLSLQAQLEPIRDFRIDITATQNYTMREEYYYKYLSQFDAVTGPLSYIKGGNYTTTVWAFSTAFADRDELFMRFLENRSHVAERLAGLNNNPYNDLMVLDSMNGQYYPAGYSANSQTVLLTSFLATYLGNDPATQSFSPFLDFPLPNWSINYNGLSKVKWLKKWFNNITLSHKYSATYSIGNYYTDAALSNTDGYDYGAETMFNNTGDYIPPVSMDGIQLNEQLSPLLRISLSMVNSLQFNFSMQKNRMMQLSFSNNQLTETTRDGITFGAGYRFKDVAFQIEFAGKPYDIKSDIVLQLNLTCNNNMTNIRKINQNLSQISSGSEVWMAELSGEYAVSTNLTLRAFFQTNINTPFISNAYPNSTTKGGLTLRLSF